MHTPFPSSRTRLGRDQIIKIYLSDAAVLFVFHPDTVRDTLRAIETIHLNLQISHVDNKEQSFLLSFYHQAINLQEDESTNSQERPKKAIADEEKESSAPVHPETSMYSPDEIKEETSVLSTQPQTSDSAVEDLSKTDVESQTSNIEPQAAAMEVHKHPHHITHKKKWNEYLLEFFMIFLAVFLGFVAENGREELVERRHEKQFINSLVNDLKEDTQWFDVVNRSSARRIQYLDSAISVLSRLRNNEIPATIYEGLQKSMIQIPFLPFNGTITQLKSSGELRLITERRVVDTLENYDRQLRRLELRRNYNEQLTHDFKQALNNTIVGKDLLVKLKDSILYGKRTPINQYIKLDSQNQNGLINDIVSLRSRIVDDTTVNASVKGVAIRFIALIRREYRLR